MKLKRVLKLTLLLCAMSFSSVFGQEEIDNLLESGISDATKLIDGYISPFMKGFGTGLGSGWYNTAKAHKSWGFDLTVTGSLAYVPDKDLFYDIDDLNLETVELVPGHPNNNADGRVPTMLGEAVAPRYREKNSGEEFDGPAGIGLEEEFGMSAVPVPMIQLGIGIVKKTDIKIRFTPKIDLGEDGTFQIIGFGVMHDIKQYIPGVKESKFDLSAFIGYTDVTTEINFDDEDPQTDNKGVLDINNLTIQGIISKKMSILTVYAGLGVNRVRSEIAVEGKYDINDDGDFDDEAEQNPLLLEFKAGGPRVTAGMRLKLAILSIHADYTIQEYNTLTAGVGFTIR